MKNRTPLSVYDWHEALDRSFICMDMVERLVLEHPVIERNEALKATAEEAHKLLFHIYQQLGNMYSDEN